MRAKTGLCGVVGVLAVTGLVVSAPPATRGKAPAKGPVARALEYAPKGTVGVIHVNVKAVGKDVAKELGKAGILGPDAVKGLLSVLGKIESADVYLIRGGDEPMPFVVLRGKIAADDIGRITKAFGLPPFKKQPNGRYGPARKGGPPVLVILGSQATDLPAGVSVVGLAPMLQPEFLKTLGQQKNEKLAGLLKGVDPTASIWGAMDLGFVRDEDAPESVAGSLHLVTRGRSKIEMVFKNAKLAAQAETEFKNSDFLSAIAKPNEIKRAGKTLTLMTETTAPCLPRVRAGLVRGRTVAKRAASMANLTGIGMAMMIYTTDGVNDAWPPDLEALVKAKQPAKMFVSPSSGRKSPYDAKGRFKSDYIYIKGMPTSSPGGMILIYEPPQFNKFEKVLVLDVNLSVSIMKPGEFKREIEKTARWLKKNGKKLTLDPKTREWLKKIPAAAQGAKKPEPLPRALGGLHLVCSKCGHEFEKSAKDLQKETEKLAPKDPKTMVMAALGPILDCPKCGAKKSSHVAAQCPNCRKRYISPLYLAMHESLRTGKPPRTGLREICPHCKTDVVKWFKERIGKPAKRE